MKFLSLLCIPALVLSGFLFFRVRGIESELLEARQESGLVRFQAGSAGKSEQDLSDAAKAIDAIHERLDALEGRKASLPLLEALGEDFRSESESHIIGLAKKYGGTPNEAFGKEGAMWHAKRLETCGLLPTDLTPQKMVDGYFKVVSKPQ